MAEFANEVEVSTEDTPVDSDEANYNADKSNGLAITSGQMLKHNRSFEKDFYTKNAPPRQELASNRKRAKTVTIPQVQPPLTTQYRRLGPQVEYAEFSSRVPPRHQASSPEPPMPFGGFIVTRPNFLRGTDSDLNSFAVHALNPSIVTDWVNTAAAQQFINSFITAPVAIQDAGLDMSLIHGVNELRMRSALFSTDVERSKRGVAALNWSEPGSGNEFFMQTSLWTPRNR